MGHEGIAKRLSDFVVRTSYEDLPSEVVNKAKMCILDSIGCGFAGHKTVSVRPLLDLVKGFCPDGDCTVIGSGNKVSCLEAAFINSQLVNATDFDDIYAGDPPHFHAGSTTIPAAIAVGEKTGASGKDIIVAVVAGYEILLRIGIATTPTLERRRQIFGMGTTHTFGAVASAAKLLKLDEEEMINAFGIAGSCAPVPSVDKTVLNPNGVSMVKNSMGWASENGVRAAVLAKHGFTGPWDIFDGESGFWVMAGSDRCDFDRLTKGLGEEYEIMNVGLKAYPVCGRVATTVSAIDSIMQKHKFSMDEVQDILVRGASELFVPPYNNAEPEDILDAQFSTCYAIAVTLTRERAGLNWFTEDKLNDPRILNVARKVRFEVDPEAEKIYPHKIPSTVEIALEGERFTRHVEAAHGSPQNPMSEQEVREKFSNSVRDMIGNDRSETMIRIICDLERLDLVTKLTNLCFPNPINIDARGRPTPAEGLELLAADKS